MFNSIALDVVISLVFIYLLYSLLATTVLELIASGFRFRSKILERAIFRMLEDDRKFDSRAMSFFYLFKKCGNGGGPGSVSGDFYKHPLVKFLSSNRPNSKPAYINKVTFSKVLVDLLRGDQVNPGDDVSLLVQNALDQRKINWGFARISDETLSLLKSFWADAQGDVEKFKVILESWFDETMERATGWYKKYTQFLLLLIGLMIAIVFNVDTISLIHKLKRDPKLREQLVQQATAFATANPDLDQQLQQQESENREFLSKYSIKEMTAIDSLRDQYNADSLAIADLNQIRDRRKSLLQRADSLLNNDISNVNYALAIGWDKPVCKSGRAGCYIFLVTGWMITALALSLGASFWFDLLNKFMKLRASMAGTSSDEQQK